MDDIKEWNDFHLNNKNKPRVNVKALRQALTHASLPNSTTPCYQRLKFLGDAVLDFMTVKYLFEKYPDGAPGLLTDLKDASVNNQVLGAICERINLHKHIIHFSNKLMGGITEFVKTVDEMRERNEAVGKYWSDLDGSKVMSDVVESMIGAIFVDSEFDRDSLEKVFDKWIKPILTEHVTPETLKVHPVKLLIEYMQKGRCSMILLRNHTSEETDIQRCTIFIHDLPVAHASSSNIRSARKLAVQIVLDKIEVDPKYLEKI
ncbi:9074_t:CDS:2, partial [Scutellospora calospora]